LVYGEEVDISLAWKPAIELAELLKAPVFQAPLASRAVFPESNPMFQGSLPIAQGPIGEVLAEFDLVLVIGAEVFRYYPWSPGPVLHSGTNLLQITEDPHDAGSARAGDSLLANAKLALEGLCVLLRNTTTPSQSKSTSTSLSSSSSSKTSPNAPTSTPKNATTPMTALEAFNAAALARKPTDLLVAETPSNLGDLLHAWPVVEEATYFTSASSFLGFLYHNFTINSRV
jgi:benzoylformate decarboxylase